MRNVQHEMGASSAESRRIIRRPFLVEVTGVAGAGKSTLTSVLSADSEGYRLAEFIHTRRPTHLFYLARTFPRLLPVVVPGLIRRPRMSWADFKLMAYVTGWSHYLDRQPEYSDGIVLLDQGPIYALVRLKAKGLGAASSSHFQRWWSEMLARWSSTLSVIIWLDAADSLLQDRINERAQSHTIKGESGETGQQFIARYRALFAEIFRDVEQGGVELLCFDTSDTSTDEIATKVNRFLGTRSPHP